MATAQFNIRMPEEIQRQVRVYAASAGVKQRDVVVLALERFFEQSPLPVSGFHVTDAMLDRALAEVGPQIRELMRSAIDRLTAPSPFPGRLTVDEAQEPAATGPRRKTESEGSPAPASRRPRAGRKVGRPGEGEAPGDGAASAGDGRAVEPGVNASPEPSSPAVDEAQGNEGRSRTRDPGPTSASRRPRAAQRPKRSSKSVPPVASPGDPASAGGEPAGRS